jgi:hypothetical protein
LAELLLEPNCGGKKQRQLKKKRVGKTADAVAASLQVSVCPHGRLAAGECVRMAASLQVSVSGRPPRCKLEPPSSPDALTALGLGLTR